LGVDLVVGAKPLYVFPTRTGLLGNLRRLLTYRELLFLMVGRDLKARYTQSMLGFYWAVLNPLVHGLIFTVAFAVIVRVDVGETPYFLFMVRMTGSRLCLPGPQGLLSVRWFPFLTSHPGHQQRQLKHGGWGVE